MQIASRLTSSAEVALELWVLAFAHAWGQLKENEQEALVKPVVVLLSKDFHTKQSSLSPNVVHGWLQALAACEPAPKLPAALLKYLTKTFNAWHLTVPMLEAHTLHLPAEAQHSSSLSGRAWL